MPDESGNGVPSAGELPLTLDEIRAVTAFAAACAARVLPVFEAAVPGDPRPREALEAASEFAAGGPRGIALRRTATAALAAAREATGPAAEAARACGHAAGSAYLHPLARATQVRHILGSAVHATLADGADPPPPPALVRAVLSRYPPAPPGRGPAAALLHTLDATLRA